MSIRAYDHLKAQYDAIRKQNRQLLISLKKVAANCPQGLDCRNEAQALIAQIEAYRPPRYEEQV